MSNQKSHAACGPGAWSGIAATVAAVLVGVAVAGPAAQDAGEVGRRQRYDEVLDTYVRDGLVYYRAMKADRAKLDGYVTSLATTSLDSASPQEQVAFWINGYNAIVLQTIISHYPIAQRTRDYPAGSIRQIPGAFERETHRLAGRTVTLDQIEQTVLPTFHDPRVFLALGRGAMGSGRLRSAAYAPDHIERQLAEDAAECTNRAQCVQLDPGQNVVRVSSIFSWRRNEFIDAYAEKAANTLASRSPIERAVLAFIDPKMLTAERDMLKRNDFRMEYIPFDWSLNDLTGRGGN
jgi:hypothetical protein